MLGIAVATVCASNQVQAAMATTPYIINNGGSQAVVVTWDTHGPSLVQAGALLMTPTAHPSAAFLTVCTDIGATIVPGSTYYYDPPAVFNGHDGIRPDWGAGNATGLNNQANATAAIQAAADVFHKFSAFAFAGSAQDKAALQLAVWEALYDTSATLGAASYSLTGGRFKAAGSSATRSEAVTWLSQINFSDKYAGYLLVPDPQNQPLPTSPVAQEVFQNVTPVPEPATMLAGALLLLPFGASTLRALRHRRQ